MKLKLTILLFSIILLNGCANSQMISGYWAGSIGLNGKMVDLSINLNSDKQTFSSYDLMLIEQPITNIEIDKNKISFSLVLDVELNFKGEIKNDQINGAVEMQNGPPNMNMIFDLTKQSKIPEKNYSIETLTIKSGNVSLSADIYKPHTDSLHPAIVLLQGSTLNAKSDYIFYADYFAKLGFEVLIFDKRGNGKSTGDYYSSSYDDLIGDAIACLETMSNRESVNKDKIGLWGLSQGAMLLSKVVSKTTIPNYLIAISPDVFSVTEAAAFSDSLRIVSFGGSETDGKIVAESHRKVEKMIREGSSNTEVEKFIHQNAQKYNFMNQTGLYGDIDIDKNEFRGFYWQGRTDNFLSLWGKLKIPTLVLFGARDNLVDAERNMSSLRSLNNENIEVKIFPKANHILKKSFNPSIDTEVDFPRIIEGYSDNIEKWIKCEIHK